MARRLFLIPILSFCLAMSVAQAAAPAAASAAPPAAASGTGLDVIAAYAGTWQTDIRYQDTPYSKKYEAKYQLHNDCWRSAGYYACDQVVDGKSQALVVFTYDPAKGYATYPIPAGGSSTIHAGRLMIDGKAWTFPWQTSKGGKTTYFHVINTWTSPDGIDFRQEYSEDGKQWQTMAEGHETRVKG